MQTPTKTSELQGLPLLFRLIEDPKKISKVKSLLKANKTFATARLSGLVDGPNALSVACSSNNTEVVKYLVTQYNVDVNSTCGIAKNTPLHEAAVNPHIDRSSNSGALGSATKKDYSRHKDSLTIIQFLIKHEANVNASNTYENTPLHAVCIEGLEDCAAALLDAGADIAQTTGSATNSSTALHLAAEYSHPNLVRYLLEQGASIDFLNGEGKTSLDVARETRVSLSEHHKQQTIELLESSNGGGAGNEDNGESKEVDAPSSTAGVDLQETEGNGSGRSGSSGSSKNSEECGTEEAARIAANKSEQEEQQKGCKCILL